MPNFQLEALVRTKFFTWPPISRPLIVWHLLPRSISVVSTSSPEQWSCSGRMVCWKAKKRFVVLMLYNSSVVCDDVSASVCGPSQHLSSCSIRRFPWCLSAPQVRFVIRPFECLHWKIAVCFHEDSWTHTTYCNALLSCRWRLHLEWHYWQTYWRESWWVSCARLWKLAHVIKERTKNRPLPSGRVTVPEALLFLFAHLVVMISMLYPLKRTAYVFVIFILWDVY